MAFHFALRDGRLPPFWVKLNRKLLECCLPDGFLQKYDPVIGVRAFSLVHGADVHLSLEDAIAEAQRGTDHESDAQSR